MKQLIMKRVVLLVATFMLLSGGVAAACKQPKVVDVCKNIEGNQETIPDGYHKDNPEDEDCTIDIVVTPPIDTVPVVPPVETTDTTTPPAVAQVVIPDSPPTDFAGKNQ